MPLNNAIKMVDFMIVTVNVSPGPVPGKAREHGTGLCSHLTHLESS